MVKDAVDSGSLSNDLRGALPSNSSKDLQPCTLQDVAPELRVERAMHVANDPHVASLGQDNDCKLVESELRHELANDSVKPSSQEEEEDNLSIASAVPSEQ